MTSVASKQVLVGISGGIAAYKAPELVRRLAAGGAEVRVVMTPAATEFITPLTLQAVSGHPVHTRLLDPAAEAAMGHIELARWADLVLIAPASADLIARLAAGMADDLLTTLCLATAAPVAIAPAMNQQMWQHPATGHNVATLAARGVAVWGPGSGDQACGEVGPGRMLEPADLAERAVVALSAAAIDAPPAVRPAAATGSLAGRHVVVTAGPTRERLDPVRYLSNDSSGKQGYAIAAAAQAAGARVTLVSGPVGLATPPGVDRIDVESAAEMAAQVERCCDDADVFIAVAAVADYRPARQAPQKLKKDGTDGGLVLELVRNPDILASVAAGPEPRPFTVGFAAETHDVLRHAREKLDRKGIDMIVANDVSDPSIGFAGDDNAVTLITRDAQQRIDRSSKTLIAGAIIDAIAAALPAPGRTQD